MLLCYSLASSVITSYRFNISEFKMCVSIQSGRTYVSKLRFVNDKPLSSCCVLKFRPKKKNTGQLTINNKLYIICVNLLI